VRRAVAVASCGPYEIVAPSDGTLFECDDGSVEVRAERSYVVRFQPEASRDVLAGALAIHPGSGEGILRFRNYVGISSLGPRRLSVCSDRLDAGAVAGMLDDVCRQLASLPFHVDTPTQVGYSRVRDPAPEVLYHSFTYLRDCWKVRRPWDLGGALQRILAGPHLTLRRGSPARVPLAAVGELDAEGLLSLASEPEFLEPVAPGSPLASHPLASSLGGTLPAAVRARRLTHSTENLVNRFVVGALETMIDLLRSFERLVRSEKRVSSAQNAAEAAELTAVLERPLRHPALAGLEASFDPPLHSTILRGKAGYRELLAAYTELLQHASRANPHDAQILLELRDAAAIYEFWCYFQIAGALTRIYGPPTSADRFAVETTHSRLPWGYSLHWEEVVLAYNLTFSPSGSGDAWPGSTSYSRPMRPDVTLRTASAGLHLFDAKLKLKSGESAPEEGFESADLHKMHSYRDALGAASVWVLYPAAGAEIRRFAVPPGDAAGETVGFRGVGAVPLRPAEDTGRFEALVAELLGR
jgi:hypothetical protein